MLQLPNKTKALNRLWNGTANPQQPIAWPFTEVIVDKYGSAHFNDLYDAILWKNKTYPNRHIAIRFGEGEWVLPDNTRLLNISLFGPGRNLAQISTGGNLWVYRPSYPVVLKDFLIQASGAGTNTSALFCEGTVSTETVYCYNCQFNAGGGSSETYGVWTYNGGVVELHNCGASAVSGGTEYGILVGSGTTCRVYSGGQYYGDTAPASVEGTLQLRDLPDIDATIIVVGAGTLSWEWTRNGSNLQARQIDPTGHLHSKLVASDGSPDPALSADATGSITAVVGLTAPNIRERLTANRTYYVRTDGSDSNTGLTNTAGGAFLTIQKGIDIASSFDLNGYNITIQVADGTYSTSQVLKSFVGDGTIVIQGNTTTPANVLVNPASGNGFAATNVIGKYQLKGFKTAANGSAASHIYALGQTTYIEVSTWDFGVGNTTNGYHIRAEGGGFIYIVGNYTISGSVAWHYDITHGAIVWALFLTITLTGTPNFSQQFCRTAYLGAARMPGNTYSGSGTGKRYQVEVNGVIDVAGAATTYFPGNVAGTTATGGQYG